MDQMDHMGSIEAIVLETLETLEMRQSSLENELSGLLDLNYDGFDVCTKDECMMKIEEYLEMTESIAHNDIKFIKRFTKVAYHALLDANERGFEPSIGFWKYAEKLYRFNLEGIAKCLARDEDLTIPNYLTLEAHFNSYAGDALKFRAENDSNLPRKERSKLEKECYEYYLEYADIIKDIKPREYGYAMKFAGESIISAAGFLKPEESELIEKYHAEAFRCFKEAAQNMMRYNPKQSAHEFARAADCLDILSDIKFLKERYQCNVSSAAIMESFNPEFSAHRHRCAGKSALLVAKYFNCTGTEHEALKYLESARKHINVFMEFYNSRSYGQNPRYIRECNECIDEINNSGNALKIRMSESIK